MFFFPAGKCRRELLDAFVGPLRDQLGQGLGLRLCAHVLGDLLSSLHGGASEDEDLPVLVMLEPLVNTLHELDADSPLMVRESGPAVGVGASMQDTLLCLLVQGSLMSCLLSLVCLMGERHYVVLWACLRKEGGLQGFLAHTMAVLQGVLLRDIFPKDWMVLRTVANQ